MNFIKLLISLPLIVILLVLQLFFLPYAIVAKKREHWPGAKLPTIMFILNLAFGWTIVGWLILLVMAQALPK
ncbi:superinfection immunity protein [Pseudoalteromonas marina]|uniref:superinfection immunity protein n=1 Tax=Pseudoalteromonas marina TaxID=267375 RepID=UPI0035C7B7A6